MRPADIDRKDRRRLAASLAVTAFLYAVLFAAVLALGGPVSFGSSAGNHPRPAAISLHLAAGSRETGTARPAGTGESRMQSASPPVPRQTAAIAAVPDTVAANPKSAEPAAVSTVDSERTAPEGSFAGTEADRGLLAGEDEGSATGDGPDGRSSIGLSSGGTPAFISWLDQAIRTKLAYPEKARNRKIEGTVTILAEVSADGKICIASVVQSSGSSILDRAAVSFVKSLFPSPVSPQKIFSGTLRIRYILRQEGT